MTARPWVVADWPSGDGVAVDDAVGLSPLGGVPEAAAACVGAAARRAASAAGVAAPGPGASGQHRPEVQLGGGADLLAGLLRVRALGDVDDDVVAALGLDLGLGHAETVDTAAR